MDSAIPLAMAARAHPSRGGEPGVSRSSASRRKPMGSHTLPDVASLYSPLARPLPLPDSSLVLFDHDLRYLVAGGDDGAVPGLAPAGCEGKAIRDVLPPDVAQALEPLYRGALAGRRAATQVAYPDQLLLGRPGPRRDQQGTI